MGKTIKTTALIIFGNLLYACGVAFFVLPGGLITGGTTGIGIFFNNLFGLPVWMTVISLNIFLLAVGFFVLGKRFAVNTLLSSLVYPLLLSLCEFFKNRLPQITADPMLCAIFGGILIGASIGIVVRSGASTGGMDIPPLVLNKLFKFPVSIGIWVFDIMILLLQMTNSKKDAILYGIILVIIYSIVIDYCLVFASKIEIKIISRFPEKIREAVLFTVDRGVTLIHSKTGFLDQETDIVFTVVANRELALVEKTVKQIDKNAFLVVSKVNEVSGRGFTFNKMYLTQSDTKLTIKD